MCLFRERWGPPPLCRFADDRYESVALPMAGDQS